MSHSGARDPRNQNPMVGSMVHLGPAAGSALPVPASLGLQLGPGSPGLDALCGEGNRAEVRAQSWPWTHSAVKALSHNCRLIPKKKLWSNSEVSKIC